MRYCSTSMVWKRSADGKRITLSNKLSERPPRLASSDLTVASSCLWSPAKTRRLANWIAIQQAGSIAYAHSSITSMSKSWSFSWVWIYFLRVLSAAEDRVQHMTSALERICLIYVSSNWRSSFLIYLNSVKRSYFSDFVLTLFSLSDNFCMSFLICYVTFALSPWA